MRHFFYVIGNGMDDDYEPNKSMATLRTVLEELKTKIMNDYNYKQKELEEAKTTNNEVFKEYVFNKNTQVVKDDSA